MTDFDNRDKLIEGKFIDEIKNRFLCLVEINGESEICYVPSSSRMDNYIDLKGKSILLSCNKNPKAKTNYSLYAVKEQNSWVLLNTNMINGLFLPWLTDNNPGANIVSEYQISDSYRCDYYISKLYSQKIIEIKSILSTEMHTRYPKVWSQRLLRQLHDINNLLQQGVEVDFYFAVLNVNTSKIEVNNEFVDIKDAFDKCIQNGLNISYFSIILKPFEKVEICQRFE